MPIEASQTKTGGHPEKWPRRQIVDAIRYLVDNGAKWRSLPADFPPWQTVYGFFARWNRAGAVTFIRDQLRRHIRTGKGRCPFPVTLIVDSQSVKAASTIGRDSRGYDAGKKINGRKRHLVVDTLGLPVMITVTAGDVRDEIIARDLEPYRFLGQEARLEPGIDDPQQGKLIGSFSRFGFREAGNGEALSRQGGQAPITRLFTCLWCVTECPEVHEHRTEHGEGAWFRPFPANPAGCNGAAHRGNCSIPCHKGSGAA